MEPQELDFEPKTWFTRYVGTVESLFQVRLYNNLDFLKCTCRISKVPPEMDVCGAFPRWCLHLKCRERLCFDKKKWMVCVLCLNVDGTNKRMYNSRHTFAHNSRYHATDTALVHHSATVASRISGSPPPKLPSPTVSPVVASMTNSQVLKLNPVIHKFIDFFKALQKEEAMKFVVNKQFCMQGNISTSISPVDARLHTLIAAVTLSQTKNENKKFAMMLQLIDRNHKMKLKNIQKERDYYR